MAPRCLSAVLLVVVAGSTATADPIRGLVTRVDGDNNAITVTPFKKGAAGKAQTVAYGPGTKVSTRGSTSATLDDLKRAVGAPKGKGVYATIDLADGKATAIAFAGEPEAELMARWNDAAAGISVNGARGGTVTYEWTAFRSFPHPTFKDAGSAEAYGGFAKVLLAFLEQGDNFEYTAANQLFPTQVFGSLTLAEITEKFAQKGAHGTHDAATRKALEGFSNQIRLVNGPEHELKARGVLKGHTESVTGVAFSPDGKTLASASGDKTVKLWDTLTGKERATLKGHDGGVTAVAFGPDGKTVVSAGTDKAVKIWDPATARCTATLDGHTDSVTCVAISPDGKRIASGSRDQTVVLWDAATGKATATLKGHPQGVDCVAFSPDGTLVASGGGGGTIKLWEVGTGKNVTTITVGRTPIRSVAFSPDGKLLASGQSAGGEQLKLWRVSTGENVATLAGHSSTVFVAFSPDGKKLLSGSGDMTLQLWDVGTQKGTVLLRGVDSGSCVTFSPDGSLIVVGGHFDKSPKLWELQSPKPPEK